MSDKELVAQLQIIKDLAADHAVKQLTSVLIKYIERQAAGDLGFKKEKSK